MHLPLQSRLKAFGGSIIRLYFSSLDDFCFKKMDFLKAEIIIGLTGIKTKYHKHITGHRHIGQGIQQKRPDHPP